MFEGDDDDDVREERGQEVEMEQENREKDKELKVRKFSLTRSFNEVEKKFLSAQLPRTSSYRIYNIQCQSLYSTSPILFDKHSFLHYEGIKLIQAHFSVISFLSTHQ